MNSHTHTEKQSQRETSLKNWCSAQGLLHGVDFDWVMISGDASFRRYFRVSTHGVSWVAVDAPPEHEDSEQFCKVAALFARQGCSVPEVLAKDFEQGFMLLSDLGDRQLLKELNESTVDSYYAMAFDELVKLQSAADSSALPVYDDEKLMQEMSLFQDWFLHAYLQIQLDDAQSQLILNTQKSISEQVRKQKQVYVHRDFHSRNLMIVDQGLALIDFQDALLGPITYDAVSLLKDVYIEWPEQKRKQMLENYFEKLKQNNILESDFSFQRFYEDFELMGLQRHLKILGIFARLSIRDGKHAYLKDLPLTFSYLESALEKLAGKYPDFQAFVSFVRETVKPHFLERQKKS